MSNCVCAYNDFEPASVYDETLRKARKVHECCECGDKIQPGDLYEYAKGLWDGHWAAYKTCARCCNVRADFFNCGTFTMMVEDFEDAHGFDYRDGIPTDFTPCGRTAEGEET